MEKEREKVEREREIESRRRFGRLKHKISLAFKRSELVTIGTPNFIYVHVYFYETNCF